MTRKTESKQNVGSLTLKLVADTAAFEKTLDRIEARLDRLSAKADALNKIKAVSGRPKAVN